MNKKKMLKSLPIVKEIAAKRLQNPHKELKKFVKYNLKLFRQLLEVLPDDLDTIVECKPKMNTKVDTYSQRRSEYTGIFKNGNRWQTLVSVMKKKTYVGTFMTEEEAARVYDFYSLLAYVKLTGKYLYETFIVVERFLILLSFIF